MRVVEISSDSEDDSATSEAIYERLALKYGLEKAPSSQKQEEKEVQTSDFLVEVDPRIPEEFFEPLQKLYKVTRHSIPGAITWRGSNVVLIVTQDTKLRTLEGLEDKQVLLAVCSKDRLSPRLLAELTGRPGLRIIRKTPMPEDLLLFVKQIGKSLEKKEERAKKEALTAGHNEYFAGFNRKCVVVDRAGNGLSQLWRQSLTMFPLVTLQAAEAIGGVYPTPKSLFKAYETQSEPASLLAGISMKRGASRRLGPTLSQKIHKTLTVTTNQKL